MALLSGGTVSELALSEDVDELPIIIPVATGATDGDLVVVDIHFYDPLNGEAVLRLANISVFGEIDKTLMVPFEIGTGIEVAQYGQPYKTTPNAGRLQYILTAENQPYLGFSLLGREINILTGDYSFVNNSADELVSWNDPFADDQLMLAFRGIVSGLSCDFTRGIVTIDFTDRRKLLDKPLIEDLYLAPEELKGRTKPQLWGQVFSIEPILEDSATFTYRINIIPIDSVLELRVGGIVWDEVASSPTPGEWMFYGGSTVVLGGTTGGGEIRLDARSAGYDEYLFGNIVAEITAGIEIEPGLLALLHAEADYRVGYYANAPKNKQDALDEIANGVGGWWGLSPDGKVVLGLIKEPSGSPVVTYTDLDIVTLDLVRILPPVWRLQVEYQKNWHPGTIFYDAVDLSNRTMYERTGLLTDPLEDAGIKDLEIDAIDAQSVPSIIVSEAHAEEMRDRLWDAWSVIRQVWQIKVVPSVATPALMDTVEVDHPVFSSPKAFRVIGIVRSFGGGLNTITLWG